MTATTRNDRGSISVEVAIVVPVALALLCLVALVGRTTTTRQILDGAARDASRAASMQRDAGSAQLAARTSVEATLTRSGLNCESTRVELDTTRFEPGGQVTAHVACDVNLSDLALIALPGTRRVTSTATSVLDIYRATQ